MFWRGLWGPSLPPLWEAGSRVHGLQEHRISLEGDLAEHLWTPQLSVAVACPVQSNPRKLRAPARMSSGMLRVAAQPRLASTNSRSSPPVFGQGTTLWQQPEMAVADVSLPGTSFLPGKDCAPAQGRCSMQDWAVREPLCPTLSYCVPLCPTVSQCVPLCSTVSHCRWPGTATLQGVEPAPTFTLCCSPEFAGTALLLPLNLFP